MLCFNVILIFEPRKAEKVGGGKAAKRDAEVAAISPCHRCSRATGLRKAEEVWQKEQLAGEDGLL